VSHAFVPTSLHSRPASLVARDSLAAPWHSPRSAARLPKATRVDDQGVADSTGGGEEKAEGVADGALVGKSDGPSWGASVPSIPSLKQYRRLRSKRRETRLDRTPHDEVIIRKRRGRLNAIPQAQRYRSSDWLQILRNTPDSIVLKRIR